MATACPRVPFHKSYDCACLPGTSSLSLNSKSGEGVRGNPKQTSDNPTSGFHSVQPLFMRPAWKIVCRYYAPLWRNDKSTLHNILVASVWNIHYSLHEKLEALAIVSGEACPHSSSHRLVSHTACRTTLLQQKKATGKLIHWCIVPVFPCVYCRFYLFPCCQTV